MIQNEGKSKTKKNVKVINKNEPEWFKKEVVKVSPDESDSLEMEELLKAYR